MKLYKNDLHSLGVHIERKRQPTTNFLKSFYSLSKIAYCERHNKYSLFKQFVLTPAYEEINRNSDINFDYEEIKSGRKVTALKFLIKSNKFENIPVVNESDKEIKLVLDIFSENITQYLFPSILHQSF